MTPSARDRTLFRMLHVVLVVAGLSCGCGGSGPGRDPDRFSVLFAGDTSYGESYQADYARAGGRNILDEEGYDYSFAKLEPMLRSSDLVVVNLETPVTNLETSPLKGKQFIHWSDVHKAPAGMKRHHIGVVSLANNHTMDFGPEGLAQTLRVLGKAGIECFGAGMNETEAAAPWRRDVRVGDRVLPLRIIGAMAYSRTLDRMYSFYARDAKPGVRSLDGGDVLHQVREIRRTEPEAFVVVFPHWGGNYEWRDHRQVRTAHRLIDAGADLVLGHGAHMMQEIERYHGKWIAYSLGNFMFNTGGRYASFGAPPYSIPVRLIVEDGGETLKKTLRFYPILSNNKATRYQPRPLDGPEFGKVYTMLGRRSPEPESFFAETETGSDEIGSYFEVRIESTPPPAPGEDEPTG